MSWLVVRRMGVVVLLVLAGSQLDGDTRPSAPRHRPADPTGPWAGLESGDARIASAPPLEPDIQVSPSALGCRSTSLTGQRLSAPEYLVVTQPGATVRVDWSVDGQALGTATQAPFVPRDATGAPVPVPLTTLAPGTHEVVAALRHPGGSTRELVGTFATGDPTTPGDTPVTITVTPADGAPAPLADWALLDGVVQLRGRADDGRVVTLDLDGRPAPATVDTASLPPGRHTLTASEAGGDGSAATVTRTFATTGGRPPPEPCSKVEVRDYGAAGDGRSDDTAAVTAATDIAMAAGATVHVSAGTYAVPTLENVLLPREVAFEGAAGAVLDGRRPGEKYDMFRVDASVSFSGLALREAGKLFTFDELAHRVDRFVIERSAFTDVYSPAHVTDAPPEVVDHIALTGNTVERAVKGFYLPLTSIGHARVSGNRLTDVGDAAIRLGSDNATSFATQRDIDVRHNAIRDVSGASDANGIKVLGVDGAIVGNDVVNVASADGTDSEGIYTKGHGHVIAGNHLRDAGRTQAQITVKSDSTSVAGNVIVAEKALTNGIRVEGSNVAVNGNHLRGGLPGSVGISTKLTHGFGGYVLEGNRVGDTDGIGISTGGDGPIIIRANSFSGVRGETAMAVRATRADTTDIQVSGNIVGSMPAADSRALLLEARSGRTLSTVRIEGNAAAGVAFGVVFRAAADAVIRDVAASGNTWTVSREIYRGEEGVDGFTPDQVEG